MNPSRHKSALLTAILIVLALLVTLPVKANLAADFGRVVMAIVRR
jgi:hypothetical protein